MNKHKKLLLILIWAFALPVFALAQFSLGDNFEAYAQEVAAQDVSAQEDTSEQKSEIKKSISELEDKLKREQKAKALLEQNLGKIQGSVYVTQVAINKAKSLIQETEAEIARKEAEIASLEEKNNIQREALRNILKELYYARKNAGVHVVLADGDFAKILGSSDALIALEEKVISISREIADSKEKIATEQDELAQVKEDHEDLLAEKAEQKQELIADKLDVQQDIVEKEATIGELNEKLAKLQGDLNVLTGKSYNASDINDAISFASKKTGVPKGILFAFLTQESGRGRNTGQCTYDDMEKKAVAAYKRYGKAHGWNYKPSVSKLAYRKGLFEKLVDALDYSKDKKVSCAIIPSNFANYEPNQGGAMGVAQFMSDTWMGSSLQSQLKSFTGHAVPDPWDLTDGTMALAIKVRDAGGTSTSSAAIKKMVKNYYGASPDTSSIARNYYNNVLYYVKNYDKLVKK